MHTLYIRLYLTVRRGGSRKAVTMIKQASPRCIGKVLAKGRTTSETQQG